MTNNEIINLINITKERLLSQYPFLKDWRISVDNAMRRAGVCRLTDKEISISKHHVIKNPIDVVMDTILHEFAHAIAFEVYSEVGHGKKWKEIAIKLGATPKATGRFNMPQTPWTLVSYCQTTRIIEKVAVRYRRNKKIKHFAIKGRPLTKGKLFYLNTDEFTLYELGKLDIEQLNFVQ